MPYLDLRAPASKEGEGKEEEGKREARRCRGQRKGSGKEEMLNCCVLLEIRYWLRHCLLPYPSA